MAEAYGPDAFITSFTSIGPKSYTYRSLQTHCETVDTRRRCCRVEKRGGELVEEVVKMKGIRFHAETNETVHGQAMRDLAADPTSSISTTQYLIKKDMFKTSLWSAQLQKRLRFHSRKRWFLSGDNPTLDTLPFGYKNPL